MLTTIEGKEIKTYQNLIAIGGLLNSRHTVNFPAILNGNEVFVYKHWSYDGTPEIRNENGSVAEFEKFSNWYPVFNEDGTNKKCENGIYNLYDCELKIKNYV